MTTFLALTAVTAHGQTPTHDTSYTRDSLIILLRRADRFEGQYIGKGNTPSKIYKRAQLLWDICSVDELVKLTSDKKAVVRCYAFQGLIEKRVDKNIVNEIADKNKNDKSKVIVIYGCVADKSTVGYFIKRTAELYCR